MARASLSNDWAEVTFRGNLAKIGVEGAGERGREAERRSPRHCSDEARSRAPTIVRLPSAERFASREIRCRQCARSLRRGVQIEPLQTPKKT